MTLLGLDLNSTRVRAAAGPAGAFPQAVALDPPHFELPLAVSTVGGCPGVGAFALSQCRRFPHLTHTGFLATLGNAGSAEKALGLVLRQLARAARHTDGAVLAVPHYLSTEQVGLLLDRAEKAGLKLAGAVCAPLALALTAYAERPWVGLALVLDADDHALTVATLATIDGQARLLEARSFPRLGLRVWRERLLNALADRCILQSRRDPRDAPATEQALFDQLDGVLDSCRHGRLVQVTLEAGTWIQELAAEPETIRACCSTLTRQALAALSGEEWPGIVFVSAAAARLPGLVEGARQVLDRWLEMTKQVEDFGEGLLDEEDETEAVVVLAADSAARAAHELAAHFTGDDLPPGYLDAAAPLPLPLPTEAGPPRLRYRGEEYLLDRPRFTLGRQPACDLVFDGAAFPMVAPRHCEIIRADHAFTLWDRTRTGTLVNEHPVRQSTALQPGDTVRLGVEGPLLRFLGQAAHARALARREA
ncbi:MAG: FHA domain-containing protein [Gemmataceae bacterium]|nr:FHA domain-containing protein [Gemmataceae bacterium]